MHQKINVTFFKTIPGLLNCCQYLTFDWLQFFLPFYKSSTCWFELLNCFLFHGFFAFLKCPVQSSKCLFGFLLTLSLSHSKVTFNLSDLINRFCNSLTLTFHCCGLVCQLFLKPFLDFSDVAIAMICVIFRCKHTVAAQQCLASLTVKNYSSCLVNFAFGFWIGSWICLFSDLYTLESFYETVQTEGCWNLACLRFDLEPAWHRGILGRRGMRRGYGSTTFRDTLYSRHDHREASWVLSGCQDREGKWSQTWFTWPSAMPLWHTVIQYY